MVVKGGRVVTPTGIKIADIRVKDGKIAEISDSIEPKSERVVDARGKYVLPAMVDIGVRVLDERLRGGTLCRLSENGRRNGFGTLVISSLSTPRIDNEITLEFVKSQAELCGDTKILPLLSGVKESGGLSDCSILLSEGTVGIEFDSHIDGNMIRRLMEYASMHGVKLFCHADDPALHGDGVMHEGSVSGRLGLAGVVAVAESSQVARIGELAEFYGVDVVILGASTPQTLRICSKNRHLHPQLSIHHALLNDTSCDNYDTAGKVWPPLREEGMRKEMLEAIAEGDVKMLTSLHTPVSDTAKDAVFAEAAYGIDGLENFLPLLYTYLVKEGFVDFVNLVQMVAANPAEAVGLKDKKGSIVAGLDADLILFDPDFSYICEDESSPYRGKEISGRVEKIS